MEYGNFRKEIMSSQKKSLGKRKAEEEEKPRQKKIKYAQGNLLVDKKIKLIFFDLETTSFKDWLNVKIWTVWYGLIQCLRSSEDFFRLDLSLKTLFGRDDLGREFFRAGISNTDLGYI